MTDSWRTINNQRYHFDSDGTMQHGWFTDEENLMKRKTRKTEQLSVFTLEQMILRSTLLQLVATLVECTVRIPAGRWGTPDTL